MGKTLVLAEKPSVGKELARVLGCRRAREGAIDGERYIVTWALGHLVGLADPEHYSDEYKTWSMDTLPIMPKRTDFVVLKETSKQYNIVKNLLKSPEVSDIVIATDAGREGELVARLIILKAGIKKPIKRLWISSQTDKAIKDGFSNLRDGRLYDNLYKSALARAKADWFVGLNVTRALTCKHNAQLSAGRVQTPTLALIVEREEEIRRFRPTPYYNVKISLDGFNMIYKDKAKQTRIFDKAEADGVMAKVKGGALKITRVDKKLKREGAPMLYDLTELQRDCNKRYNFSAKQTLSCMQRLYEQHKVLTYPRTDSRYLSADVVSTLTDRLRAVSAGNYRELAQDILRGRKQIDKRCIDDKKVSDHHAIIPTEQSVNISDLSHDERLVYDLVVRRFLCVFLGDCTREQLSVEGDSCGYMFTAKGSRIVDMGYRAAYGTLSQDDDEEDISDEREQSLPAVFEGQSFAVRGAQTVQKATTPPARFTEATLLSAMEKPGKYIEDASLRRVIENTTGLGTPATRADIIEKLFSSFYVERRGKDIFPTAKGIQLINIVPGELKEPVLTAKWEKQLDDIKEGRLTEEAFSDKIKQYTVKLVDEVKNSDKTYRHENLTKTRCPMCDKFMLEVNTKRGRMLVCQDRECGYRKNLAVTTNARCPECKKKLELVGEGDARKFVCKCGYRETLASFEKRMADKKSVMSKREVANYMRKQEEEKGESPLAAKLRLALEQKQKNG